MYKKISSFKNEELLIFKSPEFKNIPNVIHATFNMLKPVVFSSNNEKGNLVKKISEEMDSRYLECQKKLKLSNSFINEVKKIVTESILEQPGLAKNDEYGEAIQALIEEAIIAGGKDLKAFTETLKIVKQIIHQYVLCDIAPVSSYFINDLASLIEACDGDIAKLKIANNAIQEYREKHGNPECYLKVMIRFLFTKTTENANVLKNFHKITMACLSKYQKQVGNPRAFFESIFSRKVLSLNGKDVETLKAETDFVIDKINSFENNLGRKLEHHELNKIIYPKLELL